MVVIHYICPDLTVYLWNKHQTPMDLWIIKYLFYTLVTWDMFPILIYNKDLEKF